MSPVAFLTSSSTTATPLLALAGDSVTCGVFAPASVNGGPDNWRQAIDDTAAPFADDPLASSASVAPIPYRSAGALAVRLAWMVSATSTVSSGTGSDSPAVLRIVE